MATAITTEAGTAANLRPYLSMSTPRSPLISGAVLRIRVSQLWAILQSELAVGVGGTKVAELEAALAASSSVAVGDGNAKVAELAASEAAAAENCQTDRQNWQQCRKYRSD